MFLWQKSYPSPGITRHGRGIAADLAGDLAIVAQVKPAQADARMIALRLDPDGALLWESPPAIDLRTEASRVVATADGGALLVATEFSGPSSDMVRRVTADGDLDWLAYQILPQYSFGHDLALAPGGGLVVAGYRLVNNLNVPWIARLDASTGAAEWTQIGQLPGATSTAHFGVAVDAAGDIYTTGITRIEPSTRLVLRRFDPAGIQKWAVDVESPAGFARGWDVHPRPGGGVAVAGEFFYGKSGKTGGDLWVGAFDDSGALLWSDLHDGGPGESYDRVDGVVVGPDGDIHVAGAVQPGKYNGVYRRYESDGDLRCSVVVDASPGLHTVFFGIDLAPGGFPVLTGYTGSNLFAAKMTP